MIDIKIPIGLMFTLLGGLLAFYGLTTLSDSELYRKAMGLNINLWTGCGMLVFGVGLLGFCGRASRRKLKNGSAFIGSNDENERVDTLRQSRNLGKCGPLKVD